MGILRTLLALSVVSGHAGPILGFRSVGGVIAVQTFYMISGFYMSLVLSEKYRIKDLRGYWLFLSNRLLRLLPLYWLILVLTILTVGSTAWIQYWPQMSIGTRAALLFTNAAVFFQDWIMFFGFRPSTGTLFFTPDYRLTQPPLFSFLLVPQAWTLGVELLFYALAPFLLKLRVRWILAIILNTGLVRILIQRMGHYHDPWTYRFFPAELGFFLVGRLAYEGYRMLRALRPDRRILWAAFAGITGFTTVFPYFESSPVKYAYFLSVATAIPALFLLTKSSSWDRFIGELSYPIYICHILVSGWVTAVLGKGPWMGSITGAATLILAAGLTRYFILPLENYRQRRTEIPHPSSRAPIPVPESGS